MTNDAEGKVIFPFHNTNNKEFNIISSSIKSNLPNKLKDLFKTHRKIGSQYYSEDEFNSMQKKSLGDVSNIGIFHINIRSFNKNYGKLIAFLSSLNYKFEIIVLTEIWKNCDLLTNVFTEYKCYMNYPIKGKSGGVALLVKRNIQHVCLDEITSRSENYETLGIEIETMKEKITIIATYRHPKHEYESFLEWMKACSDRVNHKNNLVILGDININLLNDDNLHIVNYKQEILTESWIPCILLPTRVTETTATLIDHIYLRNTRKSSISKIEGILVTDISDHFGTFIIFKNSQVLNIERPYVRIFSEKNKEKYNEEIKKIDFTNILSESNINEAYSRFVQKVTEAFKKCFPLTRQSRKAAKHKPWITIGLIKSSKIKNNLYKKWKKHQTINSEIKYKNYQKVYHQCLKNAEENYYHTLLKNNKNNIKKTWQILNSLFKPKLDKEKKIPKIKSKDKWMNDSTDIANEFNNYFANVGKVQGESIKNATKHYEYHEHSQQNTMAFENVSLNEIRKSLKSLTNKKSSGVDDLPNIAFKSITENIAQPLMALINRSFLEGIFPDCLKVAKIKPIHKSGVKYLTENYRPISLLNTLSKIVEGIIQKKLVNYLDKYKIINKEQFGFQKNHSTEDALTTLLDSIYEKLDKKVVALTIFVDLKKAFDTVSHKILFKKLENIGIRGFLLNWFKSYLTNRQQITEVNKTVSKQASTTWGLPQGGNLSPILYLIYVNDIVHYSNNKKGSLVLFADDTSITFFDENIDHLYQTANSEFLKLNKWFESHKLAMNLSKTKYMLFQPIRKKQSGDPTNKIVIGNTEIEKTESYKYLGCIISSNLKWLEHITYIKTRISKVLPSLYNTRHKLTERNKSIIYNATIKPHLQYAITVYSKTSEHNINLLQKLQNKVLKILYRKKRNENIDNLYKEKNILKIKDLACYKSLSDIYKYVKQEEKIPRKVVEKYKKYNASNYTRTNLRNRFNFKTIRFNTDTGKKHSFNDTTNWNKLPQKLKDINSLDNFKKKTKAFLTEDY